MYAFNNHSNEEQKIRAYEMVVEEIQLLRQRIDSANWITKMLSRGFISETESRIANLEIFRDWIRGELH